MIFSLVFVYFSWQEEFQAATNLFSKLLLEDEEIDGNRDFAHGKSNSVSQNLNQSSSYTQVVSNESNLLRFNGEYISLVSESQGQVESSSSKDMQWPSVSSGASPTLTTEPQQLNVSSEFLSDSDDELEQFVLQPKGTCQKSIKLWLWYRSSSKVQSRLDQVGLYLYLFTKWHHHNQSGEATSRATSTSFISPVTTSKVDFLRNYCSYGMKVILNITEVCLFLVASSSKTLCSSIEDVYGPCFTSF